MPRLRKLCPIFILLFISIFLMLSPGLDIKKLWRVKKIMNIQSETPKQPSPDSLVVKTEGHSEQKVKHTMTGEAMDKYGKTSKEPLLDSLLVELQESLKQIARHSKTPKVKKSNDNKCYFEDEELKRHGCPPGQRKGCIQKEMSTDLRHRLEDWMHNDHLQIAPQYREIILDLEKQIEGYYHLVIVSALSSNHYQESQAMLKDIHEKIFPLVPNITLIVYDIGLTAEEHEEYQKFCRCKLIKFPLEKLPQFCRDLRCFCWKPFVIRAHLANGDMILWMDASVRYTTPERFLETLKRTEMYGLQQNHVKTQRKIPTRTQPETIHHFGFTPCAFKDYHSAASNWAMYRNSPLIQHAVLDKWMACGLNKTCTCPIQYNNCVPRRGRNPDDVGHCQRPQTAVAIILARLWMEDYSTVAAIQDSFILRRFHFAKYFEEIKIKQRIAGR